MTPRERTIQFLKLERQSRMARLDVLQQFQKSNPRATENHEIAGLKETIAVFDECIKWAENVGTSVNMNPMFGMDRFTDDRN